MSIVAETTEERGEGGGKMFVNHPNFLTNNATHEVLLNYASHLYLIYMFICQKSVQSEYSKQNIHQIQKFTLREFVKNYQKEGYPLFREENILSVGLSSNFLSID